MKKPVSRFKPPGLNDLASVDQAPCEYTSTLTEIIGVVSYSSQGGWPTSKDYSVHHFEFAAWRPVGKKLVTNKLTILRPVPSFDKAFSEFPAGTIHRVQVLLSTDHTRCICAGWIQKNARDVELHDIASELRKPVTIETERFGKLTLDRRLNWFEGSAVWNGASIVVKFEADDNQDISEPLTVANILFSDEFRWGEKVRQFAIEEKLDLANDWREEDAEPISADDFLSRMSLQTILFMQGGQFEFWHDDGDLFAGHSIQLVGSLERGLLHSDIPG